MKYEFHRMDSTTFEHMVQGLLEEYRPVGRLIQFGAGKDGAREAVWTQPSDHPEYRSPKGEPEGTPREWVFQVKYHDIGARGWTTAADAVRRDLGSELDKIVNKHKVPCHSFVLITNVPLSAVRTTGQRDKIQEIAEKWAKSIEDIRIWDAVDLSRMLDGNPGVRQSYLGHILPGDVLASLMRSSKRDEERTIASLRGYLEHVVSSESTARTDEAGDEDRVPLSRIFTDLSLSVKSPLPLFQEEGANPGEIEADCITASSALLLAQPPRSLLLAGPGHGKSTITQFVALFQALRILQHEGFEELLERVAPCRAGMGTVDIDACSTVRLPFRIELRQYIKWRQAEVREKQGISRYIADSLIGDNVESDLTAESVFDVLARTPAVLLLDGLDEVPSPDERSSIMKDLDAFLLRCRGEDADIQVVVSSRPQGYHGEFERHDPVRFEIGELTADEFEHYCDSWVRERIPGAAERTEAMERIERGMRSESFRRLASTLLQATVMLTIVRRRADVPEEKFRLFQKYVEVVFDREKSKNAQVREHEDELRKLHELIGYKIHESVARGGDGYVAYSDFVRLAQNVWVDTRGEESFSGVVKEECRRIVSLSTDRLVFLTGKGPRQEEIDFVIQPYREFFASRYLAEHIDAREDAVVQLLAERGAFWQSVLQFYVADLKPRSQKSCILELLEGSEDAPGSIQDTGDVHRLLLRFSAVRTAPEISRLDFNTMRRLLRRLIPLSVWPMWRADELVAILRAVSPPGAAEAAILDEIQACRDLYENVHAARTGIRLVYILHSASPCPSTMVRLEGVLRTWVNCEIGELEKLAVGLALLMDVSVAEVAQRSGSELADCIGVAVKALDENAGGSYRARKRDLCARIQAVLGDDIMAAIYLEDAGALGAVLHVGTASGIQLRSARFLGSTRDIIVLPPPWYRQGLWKRLRRYEFEFSSGAGEACSYLKAVRRAVREWDDPDAYRACENHPYGTSVAERFRVAALLGPSPEDLGSDENWIRYRRFVIEHGEEGASAVLELIEQLYSDGTDWCALLVARRLWPHLISRGHLSEAVAGALSESAWLPILEKARHEVRLYGVIVRRRTSGGVSLSARQTECLLEVLSLPSRYGDDSLWDPVRLAASLASTVRTHGKTVADVLSVFPYQAGDWQRLAGALVTVSPDATVEDVVEFSAYLNTYGAEPRERLPRILDALLGVGTIESVREAIFLTGLDECLVPTHGLQVFRSLESLVVKGNGSPQTLRLVVSLLHSSAVLSVEEVRLLSKSGLLPLGFIEEHENLFLERLTAWGQAANQESVIDMSAEYFSIAQNHEFPVSIRAAAVDFLMNLYVTGVQPLQERDWQSDESL